MWILASWIYEWIVSMLQPSVVRVPTSIRWTPTMLAARSGCSVYAQEPLGQTAQPAI